MKTPDTTKAVSSATWQGAPIMAPVLPPAPPKLNDRQRRAIAGLLRGPLMREELDRVAGASNGPNVIAELRSKGLEILCDRIKATDRDGHPCRPGRYSLTERDRATLASWGLA